MCKFKANFINEPELTVSYRFTRYFAIKAFPRQIVEMMHLKNAHSRQIYPMAIYFPDGVRGVCA